MLRLVLIMSSGHARPRTADVAVDENITFDSFSLSDQVSKGLLAMGVTKPSPIQVQVLPLAKLGKNIIAQSKSGTGKTLAFGIPALEALDEMNLGPQILILSPTRELAAQTHSVLLQLGKHFRGLHCHLFIGGLSYNADVRNLSPCNVVVGTPGRILALHNEGYLQLDSLRMFVLDEADKMLDGGEMRSATLAIMKSLPNTVQHLCISATYTPKMLESLEQLIPNPTKLLLESGNPTLEGVQQYYVCAPTDMQGQAAELQKWKAEQLVRILKQLAFHQCIVFSNAVTRTNALIDKLNANGWPSKAMSAQLSQSERLKAVEDLRSFRLRLLVSSDLVARGLDIDRINLVINLDLPVDAETYLHRVGRTGRFGTRGVAINILTQDELSKLQHFLKAYSTNLQELTDHIPPELYHFELTEAEQQAAEQMDNRHQQQLAAQNSSEADTNRRKKKTKKRQRVEDVQTYAHNDEEDEYAAAWQPPQPPLAPSTFWHPSQYVSYVQEYYLPYVQSYLEAE